MTQVIETTGITPRTGLACRSESLRPCSRIRGRERWYVERLKGNERLARSVEVALQSESGIKHAVVNPATGRVLVLYLPDQMQASVETLIRQALAVDHNLERDFSGPVKSSPFLLPKGLLMAELGCFSLKLLLVRGALCPVGGILLLGAAVAARSVDKHRGSK